jgi:hypothetical protein
MIARQVGVYETNIDRCVMLRSSLLSSAHVALLHTGFLCAQQVSPSRRRRCLAGRIAQDACRFISALCGWSVHCTGFGSHGVPELWTRVLLDKCPCKCLHLMPSRWCLSLLSSSQHPRPHELGSWPFSGYFSSEAGQAACISCGGLGNFYQDLPESTICIECPANTEAISFGGTRLHNNSNICVYAALSYCFLLPLRSAFFRCKPNFFCPKRVAVCHDQSLVAGVAG